MALQRTVELITGSEAVLQLMIVQYHGLQEYPQVQATPCELIPS